VDGKLIEIGLPVVVLLGTLDRARAVRNEVECDGGDEGDCKDSGVEREKARLREEFEHGNLRFEKVYAGAVEVVHHAVE
jgi:hypothetical protein